MTAGVSRCPHTGIPILFAIRFFATSAIPGGTSNSRFTWLARRRQTANEIPLSRKKRAQGANGDAARLSDEARALINAPDNDLFFSVASIWEIAIKRGLGRDDFQVEPRVLRRGLLDNGYNELAIASEHAVAIDTLPDIHNDPFDRLLVAQVMVEGVILVTSDDRVFEYGGPIRKV